MKAKAKVWDEEKGKPPKNEYIRFCGSFEKLSKAKKIAVLSTVLMVCAKKMQELNKKKRVSEPAA